MQFRGFSTSIVIIFLLGATLILEGFTLAPGWRKPTPKQVVAEDAPPKTTITVSDVISDLPMKGFNSDKWAMVEFGDFECPYCASYATETFPKIEEKWIKTNKIHYYFLNNPLPIHKNAMMLAKAGVCAQFQDHFWPVHDALFAQKPTTSVDVEQVVGSVLTKRVDVGRWSQCTRLRDDEITEIIKTEINQATRLGIQSTPTFAFGTLSPDATTVTVKKLIKGAVPFEVFDKTLTLLTK